MFKVGDAGSLQYFLIDAMPAGEFAAVFGQDRMRRIGDDLGRAAAADRILAAKQVAYRGRRDDGSGP